ncbi:response regulator transcription factor [soil metagenome]
MARIAVVDDHELVRDAIAGVLRELGHEVSTAGTIDGITRDGLDLLLLDLDLAAGGLADEQTVAQLTRRGVAVLIVSALGSPRHIRRMLAAGVAGVVAKSDGIAELCAAVDAALVGEQWMSPVLAKALVIDHDADRPKLSDNELEALRLYACGLKLDSVARRMGVAPSTAKQYIDRVRDKYADVGHPVRTKTELYCAGVEDGFITK